MSFFDYHHFPVYSIMVLFLGAFLIVMFGKSKAFRNTPSSPSPRLSRA